MYGVLTVGRIVHDLKNNTQRGTYSYPGSSGEFIGRVWIKVDQLCAIVKGGRPETCSFIYVDGDLYYHVTEDGKVIVVDKKR